MRKRLTFANVCSFLALLIALGTGGAYAANTVFSTDIVNGEVKSVDIGTGQVQSADVRNGGLKGADIGQVQFVSFTGNIGTIQANDCSYKKVTGVPLDNKDHFVLTPEVTTSERELTYTPKYDESETGDMWIQVCNHSAALVDDGTTQFNLLEIDAR